MRPRWFGLILLPIVSFSADGAVAVVFFMQSIYDHLTNKEILVPSMLARGRAIDLSIQFTLWWMPFIVLLGWWIGKPMHLLFGEPRSSLAIFNMKADVWGRLFRGRAATRLMFPRELHHCGREDELGRGPHHGLFLRHDRA